MVLDMQNVSHIAQNAGHTMQNDGRTMQNVSHTTRNAGHNTLNVCQGPKGWAWGAPQGPPPLFLKNFSVYV